MFDSAEQVTSEGIILAHHQHPEMGARRLAGVLVAGMDERTTVALASKVQRLFKKHGLKRGARVAPPPPPEPQTGQTVSQSGTEQTVSQAFRAKLEDDLFEARSALRMMLSGNVFGPVPPTMKLIRSLEEQLTALRKAEEETSASDIDEDYMVAQLRLLPRRILERALRSD